MMEHDGHWFHASNFSRMGEFLIERGVAPGDVFRAASVSPMVLMDRDSWVPRTQALSFRNTMTKMLGDPLAGMRITARQRISDYGSPGRVVMQSATVGEAVCAFARVAQLVQSGTRVFLDASESQARLSVSLVDNTFEDPSLHLQSAILWAYRMVGLAGELARVKVRLGCSASGTSLRYEEFLDGNLTFGEDRYEIVFDRELLALPPCVGRSDPPPDVNNAPVFDSKDVPTAIHHLILQTLPRTRPTVERVAAKLGTSSRTLQRTLGPWGLSFEDMVDEIRRTRALELIDEAEHALIEVAFLLGYSDQSHFNRAFRRWTGDSPRAYQKRNKRLAGLTKLARPSSLMNQAQHTRTG
jgi:AraC-like DNA-binding protein